MFYRKGKIGVNKDRINQEDSIEAIIGVGEVNSRKISLQNKKIKNKKSKIVIELQYFLDLIE